MKTAVARIHRHDGPEVLQYDDADLGDPAPGDVEIRQNAILQRR
jgi:NADPH:quinone reductase